MKKSKANKQKKRSYNSTSRKEKTELVRTKIIETFVSLLAEKRGAEVNLDEIVDRSGIPTRTIYRLFNDREALHDAADELTQSLIVKSGEQLAGKNVAEFAKEVFKSFDRNENLVLAYLYSAFGKQSRVLFRRKFNQLLMTQILKERRLSMNKGRELKLAVIIALINAKIWDDLRNDFGFDGEKIGEGVSHAIRLLISDL